MEAQRRRIVFGSASSLLLFIGVLSFKFLNLSTEKAMLFSLRLPNTFMELSGSLNFGGAVVSIFLNFAKFLLPFIFITLGFAVLALYGMKHGEDRELSLIAVLPPAVLGCVISGLSYPSLFLYAGVVLSGLLITGCGKTYSEELDTWSNFRVGTSSLGKIFLILSVLLVIGIFIHTSSNIEHYRSEYVNATGEILTGMMSPENVNLSALSDREITKQLPGEYQRKLASLPKEEREKIISELRNRTSSQVQELSVNARKIIRNQLLRSERFSSLIDLFLFFTILAIGGILLFLSKILYGPLAGLVSLLNRHK